MSLDDFQRQRVCAPMRNGRDGYMKEYVLYKKTYNSSAATTKTACMAGRTYMCSLIKIKKRSADLIT